MKKDKLIEEKINEYMDLFRPDKEVLNGAFVVLREKAVKKRKTFFRYALVSFLIAVISLIVFFRISDNKKPNPTPDGSINYSLTQTYRKKIDDQTYKGIINNKQCLELNIENSEKVNSLVSLKASDESVLLCSAYNHLSPYGLEKIIYMIDFEEIRDSSFYKYNNLRFYKTVNGIDIYYNEYYENGEYMSYARFSYQGNDYYIEIMSPCEGRLDGYLEKIFENL